MEDRSFRRIHDGPEHTLQAEAGYIDARPYCRIAKNLLHRTAGPYIWVKMRKPRYEQMFSALPPTTGIPSRSPREVSITNSHCEAVSLPAQPHQRAGVDLWEARKCGSGLQA
jgi:hypothetical protein